MRVVKAIQKTAAEPTPEGRLQMSIFDVDDSGSCRLRFPGRTKRRSARALGSFELKVRVFQSFEVIPQSTLLYSRAANAECPTVAIITVRIGSETPLRKKKRAGMRTRVFGAVNWARICVWDPDAKA